MASGLHLENPLPFGKIWDAGMVEYREFICSRETFDWLRNGGMTHVDGKPVWLWEAESFKDNVIVQVIDRYEPTVAGTSGSGAGSGVVNSVG